MKPLIKKVKGVWSVCNKSTGQALFSQAFHWCHNRNIKEGNYGVKSKQAC